MSVRVDGCIERPKMPDEQFRTGWDFTRDIESGDTIQSGAATAVDEADDSDVTATLLSTIVVSGTAVLVTLKAGTFGKSYRIYVTATMASGDKFIRKIRTYMAEA